MLQPIETPPASDAPMLAASMMPGPPPVMTPKPSATSSRAVSRAAAYAGSSAGVRADPNTATATPTSASWSKPSTNSPVMRRIRHGSVCRKVAS